MPPRLNILSAGRSLAIRSRSSVAARQPWISQATTITRRGFAEEKVPGGPNESGIGHVSEEAADYGDVLGGTKPDLEQGTPVQEILERSQDGRDKAPEVIKEEIKKPSTSQASAPEGDAAESTTFAHLLALGQLENIAAGGHGNDIVNVGHKHGLPTLPLHSKAHLKYRYDPLVQQVTNLLMRDGKKSVAQRHMSLILNHLRTSPPPVPSPTRPLLPGFPPASHLPLDPIGYLALAIDSVAPLVRIRAQKGGAGGGVALQIPVPMGIRQRRRQAVQWILDVVSKKRSRGSGRSMFAQRFAEEIVSVVEGKSPLWERRLLAHKTGTGARANLNAASRRRR